MANIFQSDGTYMTKEGVIYYGIMHSENDRYYSGKPGAQNRQELFQTEVYTVLQEDLNKLKYFGLNKKFYKKYDNPIYVIIKPTDADYKKGYITRYFIKRKFDDSAEIIEIDEKQYKTLIPEFSGLDENLYTGIDIRWKLTGPYHDIKVAGRIVKSGIIDTNQRTLDLAEKTMPGIRRYLPNLIQFAKETS